MQLDDPVLQKSLLAYLNNELSSLYAAPARASRIEVLLARRRAADISRAPAPTRPGLVYACSLRTDRTHRRAVIATSVWSHCVTCADARPSRRFWQSTCSLSSATISPSLNCALCVRSSLRTF